MVYKGIVKFRKYVFGSIYSRYISLPKSWSDFFGFAEIKSCSDFCKQREIERHFLSG